MARENNKTVEDITLIFLLENKNVDICRQHVRKFPDAIRHQNQKGENAIHIAARNPNLSDKVKMLIEEGFNVNAKNYWGQTPLHYAAQTRSIDAIHHILSEKNTDVSCKDANGYTALHFSAISTRNIDNKWKQCFDKFIKAGIDINSQTHFGQSILHLVSTFPDGLEFLRHIFQTYPDVDMFSVDFEGRSFLHVLILNDVSKTKPLHIIEEIDKWLDEDTVTALLNQQDFTGSSPWLEVMTNCISTHVSSKDQENFIRSRGVNLNTTDNMGNTALHMLAGESDAARESMDMLIRLGIDVNLKNVFGQTAVSLILCDETLELFINHGFDWDTCDRWNKTPFHEFITHSSYQPLLLTKMLENHSQYIDKQDINNSSPLHFAAYIGDKHLIKILMKYAKKKVVLDKMGDKPADTALRHGKIDCYQCFSVASATFTDNEMKTLLYHAPLYENLTRLKGKCDIRILLKDFPKDMATYSDYLLRVKNVLYNSSAENAEDANIISEVNELVCRICKYVRSYDSRFQMSVFQTGSTAEGTKVGQPDEFDFALCVESLSENCEPTIPTNPTKCQFVCLRFKETMVSDYISFSDENRYFVALPYLHYLFRYIRRALKETDLWLRGNLFMRPKDPIRVIPGKPVINFNLNWNGSKYKQLEISIDIVPVVHIAGWWPNFISVEKKKLMTRDIKEAGCFIMLQTKANRFNDTWYNLNENIEETCKPNHESARNEMGNNDRLLLQVSVAPTEIALMKSLPKKFQKAYALAKIIKRTEICPRVNLDECPSFFDQKSKYRFYPHIVNPYEEIKSYWLKNCTLYVAEECDRNTPLEITKLIYEKLLEFATSCQLKAYLFPQSDILHIEKDKARTINELHTLLLTRKVCIDTVLGILGRPFPEDNGEWIEKCVINYRQHTLTDEETSAKYLLTF